MVWWNSLWAEFISSLHHLPSNQCVPFQVGSLGLHTVSLEIAPLFEAWTLKLLPCCPVNPYLITCDYLQKEFCSFSGLTCGGSLLMLVQIIFQNALNRPKWNFQQTSNFMDSDFCFGEGVSSFLPSHCLSCSSLDSWVFGLLQERLYHSLGKSLKTYVFHIVYSPKATFNILKVSIAFLPNLKNNFHISCSSKSAIFKYKWNNTITQSSMQQWCTTALFQAGNDLVATAVYLTAEICYCSSPEIVHWASHIYRDLSGIVFPMFC